MKIVAYLSLSLFLTSIPIQATTNKENLPAIESDRISYMVSISNENKRRASVQMSFTAKDNILYMNTGRWSEFVSELEATDEKGNKVGLEKLPDARWHIDAPIGTKLRVNYNVSLTHDQQEWSGGIDGAAYVVEWGAFFTARSLFLFHHDNWEEINIHFQLPDGWKASTPWEVSPKDPFSFSARNQTSLAQAILFAGTHQELSFVRDGFELVFALGGEEVLSEKEQYQQMAEGVLDYYIGLMGGIPNPPADDPITRVLVVINSAGETDGEVIGNNISMLVEKEGDMMSQLISKFVFAHEFFHLWNGKSFRPADQRMEWFKEGFSNYYTLKALHKIGFIDENAYYAVLNNLFFQRYHTDPGVGNISMTQGEEKHDHWGLIYGGGLFVAIAQDMIIRKATSNTKNIDHFMKDLFNKFGGTSDTYQLDELINGISALSGEDQTGFFSRYVLGVERIPIEQFLSMSALEAKIDEGQLRIRPKNTASDLEQGMTLGLLGE